MMRVTKGQLRKIIREVLEDEEGYPGDGNEPVLSPGELGLNEEDKVNEIADVVTIGAGVALGIAAAWGATKLAGVAKSILGRGLQAAERGLERKMADIKYDIRTQIQNQMMEAIDGDPMIDQLVKEYQDLTYQVQTKPMRAKKAGGPKRGGIKGLRGPEYAEIRKQQKAKAKELADYLDQALSDAWMSVDQGVRKNARHLNSAELSNTRQNVRGYARRER